MDAPAALAIQTGIGLAIGLVLAWPLSRAVGFLTFRVNPSDPTVFAGVVGVVATVGLLASAMPAIRATRVEPATALRNE